jgi:hypothetical protein
MKAQTKKNNIFENDQIKFQAFGVKIGIKAEKQSYLKKVFQLLNKIFPYGLETVSQKEIEYHFYIKSNEEKLLELYRNEEKVIEGLRDKKIFFEMAESQIRITVAEFAVGKVFLHAGVIGWKGQAIVIPARSFSGKTTLVAELIKKGALYYSDEYAVLDENGNVYPFPKWLSMRGIIDAYTQLDCSVESFGATAGTDAIPVGMVLIASYNENKKIPKKWNPKVLTPGQGIMEILPHTLPIRNNPEFVLKVLNNLANRAIIVKSIRGDAVEFADTLLNYFAKKMH